MCFVLTLSIVGIRSLLKKPIEFSGRFELIAPLCGPVLYAVAFGYLIRSAVRFRYFEFSYDRFHFIIEK